MRNLKRALSLALAAMMLMGVMVVSAGAATKDFTDKGEITHAEAVNTLVALNVIGGKEDGSYFDPTGTLTRAEMAKLITYVLNGGVEPVLGTKPAPTYSDIKGHWAEAYIEYCTSMNIIVGNGSGKFNPEGTLTASQCAKMLLTAMNYKDDVFGFLGNSWEINVNREANTAGLYTELSNVAASKPISRDNAAQMVYNAIQSKTMKLSWSQDMGSGQITQNYALAGDPLFVDKFGGKIFIGTFMGNKATGAAGALDGEITVYGRLASESDASKNSNAHFPANLDLSNIGEQVKVLFKDGTGGTAGSPDKKDTIYGVYNTGATQVVTTTKNGIDSTYTTGGKIKVEGTVYEAAAPSDNSVVVTYNYGVKTTQTDADATANELASIFRGLSAQSGDTVKFVLNESGKVSAAYVTETSLTKVTSAGTSKLTMSGVGAIEIAKNDVPSGLTTGDIVIYTKLYSADKDEAHFTVAKAQTVTGKITGYTGTEKVSIEGTSYKIAGKSLMPSLTDDSLSSLTNEIGTNVIAYLVNGMVAAIDKNDTTTSSYALITGTNNVSTSDAGLTEGKVKLMMADGTASTYVVHKDSNVQATGVVPGDLVKYSVSGSTVKISMKVTDKVTTEKVWNADTKIVAGNAVAASDAVLYATNSEGAYKVYSLRSLKSLTLKDAKDVCYVKNSSGKITAAYVDLAAVPSGATSSTMYGMIIANNGVVKLEDTVYSQFVVWTGTKTTINVEGDTVRLSKGDYVVFDESRNGTYAVGDVTKLETVSGTRTVTDVAVKEYSTSDAVLSYYTLVELKDKTYAGKSDTLRTAAMDKNAVVIYVNRSSKTAGDEIGVNPFDTATGYANVKMVQDKDGVIVALLVETSGECNVNGEKIPLT